jgi:uncharacterized protein YaaW (UPF0174 family)
MEETLSQDLLTQRLQSLVADDLRSLLIGGLRVDEKKLEGLLRTDLVMLCSARLRSAAGSSTLNLTRGSHEFPYKQLLIDVADKLALGSTPLSWTKYRLKDGHKGEEIEQIVLDLFEERARRWWRKLSETKRQEFVDGINSALHSDENVASRVKQGVAPLLQQQAIEQLIQTGLIAGLAQVSASGALGVVGVSLIGQLGWVILVQTLGWMAGLKIAVFGIGGYGALGGAVTWLGSAAIGSAVALPGMVLLVDGAAYRKTVPTTVMLLAKTRLNGLAPSKLA